MTAAPSVTWLTAAARLTALAGTSPWSTVVFAPHFPGLHTHNRVKPQA